MNIFKEPLKETMIGPCTVQNTKRHKIAKELTLSKVNKNFDSFFNTLWASMTVFHRPLKAFKRYSLATVLMLPAMIGNVVNAAEPPVAPPNDQPVYTDTSNLPFHTPFSKDGESVFDGCYALINRDSGGAGKFLDLWAEPTMFDYERKPGIYPDEVVRMAPGSRMPDMGDLDNQVEAVAIPKGCTLKTYRDQNYEGDVKVFNYIPDAVNDIQHVGNWWEGRMSSAECECGHKVPRYKTCNVFSSRHFQGGHKSFIGEKPNLFKSDRTVNDNISSVSVGEGCVLEIYIEPGFKGTSRTLHGGYYPLMGNRWDNSISSMKCSCN